MSGLAVLFTPRTPDRATALSRMLGAVPERGSSHHAVADDDRHAIAVATHEWQERLCGGSVGRSRNVIVVSDATLYYRRDLMDQLTARGTSPVSTGSADLIAAAVDTWGADAPSKLEGDFAFVALDTRRMQVIAARGPAASRPLFFARVRGTGLAFASSPRALVASGMCGSEPNVEWLAELCSGIIALGDETSYKNVSQLRHGHALSWGVDDTEPRVRLYWDCPHFSEDGMSSLGVEDGAAELRRLLTRAVEERLDPGAPTIVTLSGGRDSPAIYACGRLVAGDRVRSVSLSYPTGDAGREDDIITDVLRMCGGEPSWVDTNRIPLVERPLERAALRPDAFVHLYEGQNRALSERVVALGGRVALNGSAGDIAFHAEPSYLADLLFARRWTDVRREWRMLGRRAGARAFARWAVVPRLGPRARSVLGVVRGGGRVHDLYDPSYAPWLDGDFVRRHHLARRARVEIASLFGAHDAADRERRALLLGPFFGRVFPEYARVSLESGVEQRSPYHDERVMRFAATRPRAERRTGRETKLLLRAAMRDLLPASVIGPRLRPSGMTGDYFLRRLTKEAAELRAALSGPLRCAELGFVDAAAYLGFLGKVESVIRRTADGPFSPLLFTMHAECWLRAHA